MKNNLIIKICIITAIVSVVAGSTFLLTGYVYNSIINEEKYEVTDEYIKNETEQYSDEAIKNSISNKAIQESGQEKQDKDIAYKDVLTQKVDDMISKMTLEEKVAQLFFVTPEALTGMSQVTRAGEQSKNSFERYPVGGILYFSQNFESPEQTKQMLKNMQEIAIEKSKFKVFLAIDEEGGSVSRLQKKENFNIPKTPTMKEMGEDNDADKVRRVGLEIGTYLSEYGFNLNFAPDADVLTEPQNTVIGDRSFGKDPYMVSNMAREYIKGLEQAGVFGCYKHFPGHGGTLEDSHNDFAYSYKTLEELKKEELVPFLDAVDEDVPFIMVSHISLPNVTGDNTPASLSKKIMNDFLREELKYKGIIITDALDMGAINNHYSINEAVKMSFNAGADMLLITTDFKGAYASFVEAVKSGEISQERLDESLKRILALKLNNQINKKSQ